MQVVVVILIVLACAAAVAWNKRNAAMALAGVEFTVPVDPARVGRAVQECYCTGVRAKAKAVIGGFAVTQVAPTRYRVQTKLGDVGEIVVSSRAGNGVIVTARTTELYVGSHPASHFRTGLWNVAARTAHGWYKLLGVTPGAADMKRFQNSMERRLLRKLARS